VKKREAIKYCHQHDILKEYLEFYGSEVLSMLYTEFNIDEAKEVWQEEAVEKAREDFSMEIARKALAKGLTPEFIQEIIGLDLETIQGLSK